MYKDFAYLHIYYYYLYTKLGVKVNVVFSPFLLFESMGISLLPWYIMEYFKNNSQMYFNFVFA